MGSRKCWSNFKALRKQREAISVVITQILKYM